MFNVLLIGVEGREAAKIADSLRGQVVVHGSYDYEDTLRIINERDRGYFALVVFAHELETNAQITDLADKVCEKGWPAYADTGRFVLNEQLVLEGRCVGIIPDGVSTAGFVKKVLFPST